MNALIFSSYTNAYAVYLGLKKLQFNVATTEDHPVFPIPSKVSSSADWLFFTEEASLRHALEGKLEGNYLPKKFPLDILDNKWAFVQQPSCLNLLYS